MEFFLAGAEFVQALQRDFSKFAAGPRERVGHVRQGNTVFVRKLLVGNLLVALEVVSFEQVKGSFALARNAKFALFLDSQREQAAHPFLLKEFFEGFRRRDFRRIDYGYAQFFFRR